MRRYFDLPGFADHFISVRARWKQASFSAEAFCFFGKSFFKRLGLFEAATLHDTTSCLRVLTVGLMVPILIGGPADRQFKSEQFKSGGRDLGQ
jgi:hypothetical protein